MLVRRSTRDLKLELVLIPSATWTARAELVEGGVDLSEIRHLESDRWVPGPGIPNAAITVRTPASATPTATPGSCRRLGEAIRACLESWLASIVSYLASLHNC